MCFSLSKLLEIIKLIYFTELLQNLLTFRKTQ
jgi:hypothetical protein